MKNEIPEYMTMTESAEQNNQDNIEETTTFIQETFEIIDDPSSLENKQQTMITEDGTTTTITDNQVEGLNPGESADSKSNDRVIRLGWRMEFF
jgi:hypothetical protein